MNITIQIQAPELVQAINNLASALSRKVAPVLTAATVETAATSAPVPPQMAAPVPAPAPAPAVPPVAQDPVYTAPVTPPGAPVAPIAPTAPAAVPTATQTYTIDQLAVAATQLVDAGRREELVNLLASFGVQALTELPKEQYGAFATQLRAMGAKI